MSRFLRFGSADALPALAAVFLCGTSVLAVDSAGNALTHEGWTIAADTNRACLTIQHTRLGRILQEVHLNLEIDGTLGHLKQWKADTTDPSRFVVRTLANASTWSFEPARDRLTISSTAPGAVLTAQAPVSPARRLARLLDPDGAPVTWQGTGEVAGSYGGSLTPMPFRDSHRYPRVYKSISGVLSVVYTCTFLSSTPLSWGCETILSFRWLPSGLCSQS